MRRFVGVVLLLFVLATGAIFIIYPMIPKAVLLLVLEQQKFIRSPTTATKKWGHQHFDIDSFRAAPFKERASQISDLMENKALIGMDVDSVKQKLGAPDGDYFNQDGILTYRIVDDGNEKWDLVLEPYDGKINSIKVYRACCNGSLEDWLLKDR